MKVILQENIDSLGYMGDVLDVGRRVCTEFLAPPPKSPGGKPP